MIDKNYIINLVNQGMAQTEVARALGISRQRVNQIVSRRAKNCKCGATLDENTRSTQNSYMCIACHKQQSRTMSIRRQTDTQVMKLMVQHTELLQLCLDEAKRRCLI